VAFIAVKCAYDADKEVRKTTYIHTYISIYCMCIQLGVAWNKVLTEFVSPSLNRIYYSTAFFLVENLLQIQHRHLVAKRGETKRESAAEFCL
jgi:hypothetical protein